MAPTNQAQPSAVEAVRYHGILTDCHVLLMLSGFSRAVWSSPLNLRSLGQRKMQIEPAGRGHADVADRLPGGAGVGNRPRENESCRFFPSPLHLFSVNPYGPKGIEMPHAIRFEGSEPILAVPGGPSGLEDEHD
jgi:hypothetical protein